MPSFVAVAVAVAVAADAASRRRDIVVVFARITLVYVLSVRCGVV